MTCIFCRIIDKKVPSKKVYEDQRIFAFEDINPQAPVHILLIPKKHIATVLDITDDDHNLIGAMFRAARRIAREKGVAERGFRLVLNCNAEAGQTVYHLHMHFLAGRPMHWPPG